jgi:hypothetical protein
MSEIIDRVALAMKAEIARQFGAKPLLGDSESGDWAATGGVLDLSQMARVAIEAMREPTEAMLGAEGVQDTGGKAKISGYLDYFSAEEIWKAMIDAALKS